MLLLNDISVEYSENKHSFLALEHINLKIKKGQCLAILGKSGCGKSTLLNVMAGIRKPTGGTVQYCGKEMREPISEISMIFQNYGLFPWKTVRDNMLLPIRLKHRKVDEDKLNQLAMRLGLEQQMQKYPCQLSGGEKQRVSIGRAVMNNAKLLLMDEPFAALDPQTKENLQEHLQGLFEEQKMTVVIVTHNIDEAVSWGDEIAIFDRQGGTISKILDNRTLQPKVMKNQIRELLMCQ